MHVSLCRKRCVFLYSLSPCLSQAAPLTVAVTQTEGESKDGALEVQIILSNGVTYCRLHLLLQCRCPPRLISNYLSVRRGKKKGVVVSTYLTTILLLQQTWIPVHVSVAITALSEPTFTNRSLYYSYTPHTHMKTKIFYHRLIAFLRDTKICTETHQKFISIH